jgi:nitrate reductase gamma subunit
MMYEFLRGPLVWIAFALLVGGGLYRVISMILGAQKERGVVPTMSAKFGMRSLAHWVVPFAAKNMRLRPLFTVLSFSFHICLLLTPLFVMGHAVLWEESWGIRWWSLPPGAADTMTLVVIFVCLFFFLRRLALPQVRHVSEWSDFVLVLLVVSPFLTGYVAHQQWFDPELMLTLHVICGALWLIAIPFTRLSHMIFFPFTRAFMGSEFGAVRNARDY